MEMEMVEEENTHSVGMSGAVFNALLDTLL